MRGQPGSPKGLGGCQAVPRALPGRSPLTPSDLADAASGTLSARVPGDTVQGRIVSQTVLQSSASRRSDLAADQPLWLRRSDFVFGYSRRPRRSRPAAGVRRRRRSQARTDQGSCGPDPTRCREVRGDLRKGLRNGRACSGGLAQGNGFNRILRGSVDCRDVHGGGRAAPRIRRRRGYGPIATPWALQRLIDLLVEASIEYLGGQVKAGADVLQIFDTWAGSLPEDEFQRWVSEPTRRIVCAIKARHPSIPIIGFARGAGVRAAAYGHDTGVDGLGCDTSMPLAQVSSLAKETGKVVQGNLDPLLLVAGGRQMEDRVRATLAAMHGTPFIFNLGHGIVPQTPPDHVARLVELVRRAGI